MENEELIYAIIKTAVNKGIQYIEDNPKRGVRNLVDLGDYCATGRFQKDFFDIAHDILNNENSSYYQIIENAVKNISHDTLISFGINLGYNSWTKGAGIVRQHEINNGCNVPWTIVLDFEKICENQLSSDEISNLISYGKKIGIYCYMFMIDSNIKSFENITSILKQHEDCAFILFLNPNIITDETIKSINKQNNIIVSVLLEDSEIKNNNEIMIKKTNLLLKSKCMFGVYKYYDDNYVKKVLNGEFAKEIIKTNCNYAFLIKKENCSEKKSKQVSNYVKNARMKNNSPVFIMDFYEDIANIDRNISVESCFLSINSIGQATISSLYNQQTTFNIRNNTLEQILASTMPKIKY